MARSGDTTGGERRIAPGSGRRRSPAFSKGRQLDPAAHSEIAALLGDRPRDRDLLIEHLHLVQDTYGSLGAAHLQALAVEMRLAMAEVYEVASFYAHFDIVLDGETPPPAITVRVCDSLTCALGGAGALLDSLPGQLGAQVRVVRAPCMGRCDTAPVAEVGHRHVDRASVESVAAMVKSNPHHPEIPGHVRLDEYVKNGGYTLLQNCVAGTRSVDDVIGAMEDSRLRGLGGAGFPAGRKWHFVRQEPGPRLMAVNADEGEPGTFKDRYHLERDPHRFLEGMLVAAWAIDAEAIYIYLRDEYPAVRAILLEALADLERAGLNGDRAIHLRRGAGAYICGEESAMLESIEGKRGLPRHKPPYPSQVGLFGRPTLVHNVETLYWVRDILERGPDWFSGEGRNGRRGRRSFSVSGRVKRARREVRARRRHGTGTDRRVLRRHGRRPHLQSVSAGRRVGRHIAGEHGRHPARLRYPRRARRLHRVGGRGRAVRQGQRPGRGTEPDALLRGRELWAMHAVSRRHREGRGS